MIRLEGIEKTVGLKTLFQNVTYHFPEGERIALVGANGAGKTTLLNVISGVDHADSGNIICPNQVRIGYLPQEPNPNPKDTLVEECIAGDKALAELSKQMARALTRAEASHDPKDLEAYAQAEARFQNLGGYSLKAKAVRILTGLGFPESMHHVSPKSLSGGFRMRLELARLFIYSPEFLVLDEPTNHLDLPSLVWVEDYLKSFQGTLLLVSHDRTLLNKLATITLHLAGGRLTPYRGNFDEFLVQKEETELQLESQREDLKRRREQMESFVERFGAKATKASQAQSRVKMIEKIARLEDALAPTEEEASIHINLPPPGKTPRIVYEIENGAIGYTKPLATKLNLTVERGFRIAIIGANGIGKSTLLRTIAGRLTKLDGRFSPGNGVDISYFSQDQAETLDFEGTVLENVLKLGNLGEKEARSLLGGLLFRGDDVKKQVKVLSGGEKSRVGLAVTLSQTRGLLLLDEPTNHLDMTSVEMLANAFADFAGTLLFVSHDRGFINSVATHIFAMLPDGRSMLFTGQLADYARLADTCGFPNVLMQGTPTEAPSEEVKKESSAQVSRDQRKQKQKIGRDLEKLQSNIDQMLKEINQLDEMMSHAATDGDFAKVSDLDSKKRTLEKKKDDAEEAWLLLSEEFEGLPG